MYRKYIKRIIDITVAVIILIITSPVILAAAIICFVDQKGTMFYIQERPGLNGKIFKIIKFKTMNDQRDQTGKLLPDVMRITKWGRLIRALSIDEFPQLINVITGDMSLIGPRPLLVKYLELYNTNQMRRHCVRPGITGLAQVNGRNTVSWEQRFDMDIQYVDHLTFKNDCIIAVKTICGVLSRKGINSGDKVTMAPFTGSRKNDEIK